VSSRGSILYIARKSIKFFVEATKKRSGSANWVRGIEKGLK
jgi:hypothetical protein